MKPINAWKLGLSYAGFFLGAGYVSGQELYQFFGPFGKKAIPAFFLSFLLFFLYGLVTLRLPQRSGRVSTDSLIVWRDRPVLRGLITLLEVVFLFGCAVIMTAGVGALLQQLLGLPSYVGCALFALLVALLSLCGLQGVVSVFSFSVPLLCAAPVAFCIYLVAKGGLPPLPAPSTAGGNPLLSFFLISAVAFPSYSSFGSVAVLAPLSPYIRSKRDTVIGILLGVFLLFVVGCSVLLSLYSMPFTLQEELPMLALASSFSKPLGYFYGFLLLCAMFGAALSSMVAVLGSLGRKLAPVQTHGKASVFLCCFLMFLAGLFGFGNLISVIYPIYGYIGFVCMTALVINAWSQRRRDRLTAAR